MYSLAEKLKMLRKRKKLSQEVVAKHLKLSQSAIGHHESGTKKPSRDTVAKYAGLYGVSIDYLMGTDNSPIVYPFVQEEIRSSFNENKLITKEDLKANYKLMVGDKEATDEEIEEAIRYIMIQRMMKNSVDAE
jgi:transcriptional regulator with XRE-family HTH domain